MMMRGLVLLVLVTFAAGCASDLSNPPKDRNEAKIHDSVRRDFEAWNDANARGDVAGSWTGLSVASKMDWLRKMLNARDAVVEDHLMRLNDYEREILERWHKAVSRDMAIEAKGLPQSILGSRWFYELYEREFKRSEAAMKKQAEYRKIKEIYPGEDGGVTVMTEIAGVMEMYGMIWESGGWKLEVHRTPRPAK